LGGGLEDESKEEASDEKGVGSEEENDHEVRTSSSGRFSGLY
jgi:hypothetical protein